VEVQLAVVRRRPKGTPPKKRDEDPAITAALENFSVLTTQEQKQRTLLGLLVKQEQLELEEGADLDQLAIRLTPQVETLRKPATRAAAISAWLLEQDEVVDLYLDDEDLTRIIADL